jgi:hypothetical protein
MNNKVLVKVIIFFLAVTIFFGAGILIAEYRVKHILGTSDKAVIIQHDESVGSETPKTENLDEQNQAVNEQKKESLIPISHSTDEVAIKPFSFAIIGDTRKFDNNNPKGNFQKAIQSINRRNLDMLFAVGDLIANCDGDDTCRERYENWKEVLGPDISKTYEIVGNHDRAGGERSDQVWQETFNLPTNGPEGFSELTYSFDYVNSHFIVLDSEKPGEHVIDSVQRNWLENDLNANKKTNIFVFYHEPAFQVSEEKKSLDLNPSERDLFWDIIKKYKVTAVFNGHEHIFSRKKIDGVVQVVVGDTDSSDEGVPGNGLADFSYKGKHFAVVAVNDKKISIKLYSVEGNLLNSFNFVN